MMPDRIGTIVNTQGVKARPSPARKNTPAATQMLDPVMICARRACSDTGAAGSPAAGGAISLRSLTTFAAGRLTVITWVCGM